MKKVVTFEGGNAKEHGVTDEDFNKLAKAVEDVLNNKGDKEMGKPTYKPHEAIALLGKTHDASELFDLAAKAIDKIEHTLRRGEETSLKAMIAKATGRNEITLIEHQNALRAGLIVDSCYVSALDKVIVPDITKVMDKLYHSRFTVETIDRAQPSRAILLDLTEHAKNIALVARDRAAEHHHSVVKNALPTDE